MSARDPAGAARRTHDEFSAYEVVTMSGHRYVTEHLIGGRWHAEHGFLERRLEQRPVRVDRRRASRGPALETSA